MLKYYVMSMALVFGAPTLLVALLCLKLDDIAPRIAWKLVLCPLLAAIVAIVVGTYSHLKAAYHDCRPRLGVTPDWRWFGLALTVNLRDSHCPVPCDHWSVCDS